MAQVADDVMTALHTRIGDGEIVRCTARFPLSPLSARASVVRVENSSRCRCACFGWLPILIRTRNLVVFGLIQAGLWKQSRISTEGVEDERFRACLRCGLTLIKLANFCGKLWQSCVLHEPSMHFILSLLGQQVLAVGVRFVLKFFFFLFQIRCLLEHRLLCGCINAIRCASCCIAIQCAWLIDLQLSNR